MARPASCSEDQSVSRIGQYRMSMGVVSLVEQRLCGIVQIAFQPVEAVLRVERPWALGCRDVGTDERVIGIGAECILARRHILGFDVHETGRDPEMDIHAVDVELGDVKSELCTHPGLFGRRLTVDRAEIAHVSRVDRT